MKEPLQLSKQEATAFFAALFYGEHHIPGELKEAGKKTKAKKSERSDYHRKHG